MSASPESVAFTPLKVGDVTLGHRIAVAPLTRMRADEQHVHHDVAVEYYAQRASYPGTLIVTEATFISAKAGGYPTVPGIYTPAQIDAWKKIVDAIHAKGSFVFLQLWALGRAADAKCLEKDGFEVVSASDAPFEGGAKPRPLTEEEIKEYVRDYAAAAKAFVEGAGGDGVEIHAANGYLIDQFTQLNSNKRTDRYSGTVENRCRFGLEVAAAVTAAVGPSKVGLRLSPFTDFQGMKMPRLADIHETFAYFATELKKRFPGMAYLHLVEPRASGLEDCDVKEGESLDFIADVWGPKPLLIAGGHKLEDAERSVRKYENSVAVYGRYFISNPDLVARVKHNIPFRPYDRSTFYKLGPKEVEGYTTYPVEYGPEGKIQAGQKL